MKLYIIGSPGSGKTTLARRISEITGAPCAALDEVQYEPDPDSPGGNRRRSDTARDRLFEEILGRENWIIEDTGRKCFRAGQERAEKVVALDIPRRVLLLRVTRRWLRQRAGIERAQYKSTFKMLRLMWKWTLKYSLEKNICRPEKTVYLKNSGAVEAFLNTLTII